MKILAGILLLAGAACFLLSRISKKAKQEENQSPYGKVKVLSTAGATLLEGGVLLMAMG